MVQHPPKNFAVLMSDLVRSERNPATEHLYTSFNAAIERQNRLCAEALSSPLTITLGDEFQGLVTSFAAAAYIAREIRFDLMDGAVDCRFALGLATLKTPLNTERAWNMMGPGLASTRARLNEKRGNNFYRFSIPDHPVIETMLEASGASLTAIERSWTATQRADIRALLKGNSPTEIAKRRNVTVHTIYKVRGSGDFDLYLIHWNAIREALAEMDRLFSMKKGEQWSTRLSTP